LQPEYAALAILDCGNPEIFKNVWNAPIILMGDEDSSSTHYPRDNRCQGAPFLAGVARSGDFPWQCNRKL